MPFMGKVFAGCQPAYTYLPESIRLFPGPDELKSILERIGFRSVIYKRLTDGIAVVHLGKRAELPPFFKGGQGGFGDEA
jgi:demethylmenaquinone methyltransferase/2-methoxy-6-polyprenyl-1,4-benzoquinol methylase